MSRTRTRRITGVALAISVLLGACTDGGTPAVDDVASSPSVEATRDTPSPTPTPSPTAADPCDRGGQNITISMVDFAFEGRDRSGLCVGDTITFVNNGDVSHTGTNRGGSFDTGTVQGGQSATVTIADTGDTPGTIRYVCLFHSQMSGSLQVQG